MAKFDKQLVATQKQDKTAPPYPGTCSVSGCDKETDVVFMRVFNNNTGKPETGSFGSTTKKPSYGYVSNGIYCMHPQFDFKVWITRCCVHYMLDLQGRGMSAITCAGKH